MPTSCPGTGNPPSPPPQPEHQQPAAVAGWILCTQIGNDHFTWFGTTVAKSRLNFLDLLRAGHADYVVNDAALAYMRRRALAGPVIGRLAAHPDRTFADAAAWQAHLQQLGVAALEVTPDPVRIATEGALWGSVTAHGLDKGLIRDVNQRATGTRDQRAIGPHI